MAKDPAFLLYSKDFYEGTRMMLPEERACYIDLMIYQHQNGGFIPNNLRRLMMYCSGISEATIQATLEAKFKLCDKGWYNEKLQKVVSERENFSKKQSINGIVGQFWKRANKDLSKKELSQLKKIVSEKCSNNKAFNDDWLTKIKDPKAMLEAMLKHLEDVIVIEDVNKEEDKVELNNEKPKIEFQKIVDIFNSVCVNLSKVQKVTTQRKSAINARVNDYGLSKIGDVFQIVANSEFLNGNNDRGWKADFDWVMNPNNFIKILEGKYKRNGQSSSNANQEQRINRQSANTIRQNMQGW